MTLMQTLTCCYCCCCWEQTDRVAVAFHLAPVLWQLLSFEPLLPLPLLLPGLLTMVAWPLALTRTPSAASQLTWRAQYCSYGWDDGTRCCISSWLPRLILPPSQSPGILAAREDVAISILLVHLLPATPVK